MSSVLICATPVHGHVTPLLAVTRHLVASGHSVRFLTGAKYRDAVEAAGATHLPLPADADFDDTNLDAAFPGRVGLKGPAAIKYDLSNIFLKPGISQVRAVDDALASGPADVVLFESMFFGAAALISRDPATRPPIVYLGIVPLSLASVDTAPFGLGIKPMRGPIGRIRNALLYFAATRIVFRSLQKQATGMVRELTGGAFTHPVMDYPRLADAVVQFTVSGFEYPRRDLPGHVHFVGPVSRTRASDAPVPAWWDELESGRPVVHVTQGTIANQNWDELVAPAILGLAGEEVLVVVSTGGRDVASLPHPLPANVRAAKYLPYDRLLPLTDVFVTNGGYGGVHYALEHGVPLVVAGATEDKAEVTARVDYTGAGINLRTNAPTAGKIRDAVREVLADARYGTASARIGKEIVASPGVAGLEKVIEELRAARVS